MNGQNEEDLKELFERFISAEPAEKVTEDVRQVEQILREHPAPQPSDELMGQIKSQIAVRLQQRRTSAVRAILFKAAGIAAVLMILTGIGLKLFEKYHQPGETTYIPMPTAVWESANIAGADVDLAILTAEVDEIEAEMLALQSGENGSNGDTALRELEIELAEIDSEFWKG